MEEGTGIFVSALSINGAEWKIGNGHRLAICVHEWQTGVIVL